MSKSEVNPICKAELDSMKCSKQDCQDCSDDHPLILNQKCHSGMPSWIMYDRDEGVLVVNCAVCGAMVAKVIVGYAQ